MFKGAKVLVAGGAGFIGANLIKRLLVEGASVRATIHRKEPVIIDDRVYLLGTVVGVDLHIVNGKITG